MSPKSGERQGIALIIVRYGLGTVLLMAGVVLLAVNPGGFGVDGFGMAAGAGLSVLLLNFLFSLGCGHA
jgi:hypothetical protein